MSCQKTMTIFVLDQSASMGGRVTPHSADSKLKLAKNFIASYMVQRMSAVKTSEFGIVTYGSDVTNNSECYENINQLIAIGRPTIQHIATVDSIEPASNTGVLVEGIIVGQGVLLNANQGKKYNRIMILITDGETDIPAEDIGDIQKVVKQLEPALNFKKYELKDYGLYIALIGKVSTESSREKIRSQKLFSIMAAKVPNSRFVEVETLGDLFQMIAAAPGCGTRPTLSKISLRLTNGLSSRSSSMVDTVIPCEYYSELSTAKLPSLKKSAQVPGAAVHAQLSTQTGGDEDNDDTDIPSSVPLKRSTLYLEASNPEAEVPEDRKVKGYQYGSVYVPITSADEPKLHSEEPAFITIIATVPASRIPRHHLLDAPLHLHPLRKNQSAQLSMSALCLALLDHRSPSGSDPGSGSGSGLVALARVVKKDNAEPYLGALIPATYQLAGASLTTDQHYFLLYHLPCAEDVRSYDFRSLASFAAGTGGGTLEGGEHKQQQRAAMSSLVAAATLQPGTRGIMVSDPVQRTFYLELTKRLVKSANGGTHTGTDAGADTGAQSAVFLAPFAEQPSISTGGDSNGSGAGAGAAVKAVVDCFPLERQTANIDKRKRIKKDYWGVGDVEVKLDSDALAGEGESGARGGSASDAPLLEALLNIVLLVDDFKIGSPSPQEDFMAVLEAIQDNYALLAKDTSTPNRMHVQLGKALEKLLIVVQETIENGAAKLFYRKAVECLVLARSASAQLLKDGTAFNAFLRGPLAHLMAPSSRHAGVKRLLLDNVPVPLTLLTAEELGAEGRGGGPLKRQMLIWRPGRLAWM